MHRGRGFAALGRVLRDSTSEDQADLGAHRERAASGVNRSCILILGAGQVGSAVAASLVAENTNLTVVDQLAERLKPLEEHMDLRTLVGDAAHPSVLREAGAEDMDMLLAVTYSDQVNLVAVRALRGGPLVGQALRSLHGHLPAVDVRVVAIFRAWFKNG